MEIPIASRKATASGRRKAPVTPSRIKIGATATAVITVATNSGPRISAVAASSVPVLDPPDWAPSRSRRRTLSTATTASSTTMTRAITSPATVIMFRATPKADSTATVDPADTATVRTLTSAARQSNRTAPRSSTRRMLPRISVVVRFAAIVSTKVAGR